ncbi:MAG: DNA replication/repair protein RecF [Ruminococcaceae bacterium]|nr:DNA replication/repair protein RecF [Oscillospiraceae bacterium]
MIVNSLKIQNFRNIENMEINPCDGVNIIYGENAQGKTNLLESLWLFTGCRSFRGSKDKEFIKFGKEFTKIELQFNDEFRNREASIIIDEKKKVIIDGIEYTSTTPLFSEFLGIIFAPNHLNLIKGAPAERRRFINMALCQLRPKYSNVLARYKRVLEQRNSLLKDINYHSELYDTLDIWDNELALLSAAILNQRLKYLEEIEPFIEDIYSGISRGKEKISLEYESEFKFESVKIEQLKEEFLIVLKENRKKDLKTGITGIGPHRDDILFSLDGLPTKVYGSQGQQRSSALALKLSEAAVIKKITRKQPIAFLDDVMSELDVNRQDYILNHIDGWQVFITCCEPSTILKSKSKKVFEIKGGELCSCT